MKIPVVLELLLITTLVAYASAKSVVKAAGDEPIAVESTTFRLNVHANDSSIIKNGQRQDESGVEEVQIVEELADSQEVIQDPSDIVGAEITEGVSIENNDIDQKPIENDKPINENDPNPINKFCTCSSASCKCCRDFTIPLIPIRGPGCATVRYLDNNRLSLSIKYGDLVLASRQVDASRPAPICLPLPGGYNRFCGRVYGISRQDDDFKACLGLELRADDDVEASLRVSCFKFGPKGLATMEAEPLPVDINDGDDDDDDDDDLGLGELAGVEDDYDDDDDDEGEAPSPVSFLGDVLGGVLGGGGGGGDDDDDDFGGFSILGSASDFFTDFFGGDSTRTKSKKKPNEAISIASKANAKPTKKTQKPVKGDDEADDNSSVLDVVEETIEDLTNDDEEDEENEENEATTVATKTKSGEDKNEVAEKDSQEQNDGYDDDDNDNDAAEEEEDNYDDDDDADDDKTDEAHKDSNTSAEKKPIKNKKKKVSSSYGFDFLGRFFNLFSEN